MSRRPSLAGALLVGALAMPVTSVIAFAAVVAVQRTLHLRMEENLPLLLIAWAGSSALVVLLLAGIGGFSLPAMRERNGLDWPPISFEAFALATAGVLALGIGTSELNHVIARLHWLPETHRSSNEPGISGLVWRAGVVAQLAWVLASGIVPGVVEELLYRGHMQRGLLAHWPPAAAILVTSAVFAAWHLEASKLLTTFTFGCWVGWIAWRCDSIVPGMLLHAINNCVFGLMGVLAGVLPPGMRGPLPSHWPDAALLALSLGGLALAVACAWLLSRKLPPAPAPTPLAPLEVAQSA